MTDHTVAALVDRRRELAGEMHTLQTRLYEIHASLAALDDVIRQFDPDYALETIRPKYRRAATPTETASISRAVLDTLRRSQDPITAKAVVRLSWRSGG